MIRDWFKSVINSDQTRFTAVPDDSQSCILSVDLTMTDCEWFASTVASLATSSSCNWSQIWPEKSSTSPKTASPLLWEPLFSRESQQESGRYEVNNDKSCISRRIDRPTVPNILGATCTLHITLDRDNTISLFCLRIKKRLAICVDAKALCIHDPNRIEMMFWRGSISGWKQSAAAVIGFLHEGWENFISLRCCKILKDMLGFEMDSVLLAHCVLTHSVDLVGKLVTPGYQTFLA